MKASFFIAAFCLASLSVLVGWIKFKHNRDHLSITVNESRGIYGYEASFNEDLTWKVQDYINHSISPERIFSGTNDYFNVTTTLKDGTVLNIKESPGELEIKVDKEKNSWASYQRIKKICDGLTNLLKQK
ncbi:MAG TPA: hypothetical protein VHA56_17695 [Mucilaginibacter sp.]|nr:hypothetical protein [Mucilaginibacter sp.]